MSEREYEPDTSSEGYHWWVEPSPRPHRGHIPAALFARLDGGEHEPAYGCRTYPTREAALAALAAARAKAGGGADVATRHPQAAELHDGNGWTATSAPDGSWEFSGPGEKPIRVPAAELGIHLHNLRMALAGERESVAELLAACKRSLAFVNHTLEFFGWGQFPNLEREVEELRDNLKATIARAGAAQ